jgi:hypothetical protein
MRGFDAAMAFSWQDINLSSGASVDLRMVVKFGTWVNEAINFSLTVDDDPSTFISEGSVLISYTVTSGLSDGPFRLYILVDNSGVPLLIRSNVSPGSSSFDFYPSAFLNSSGIHEISFYAVGVYGDISSGVPCTFRNFTVPRTRTPAPSPMITNLPTMSIRNTYPGFQVDGSGTSSFRGPSFTINVRVGSSWKSMGFYESYESFINASLNSTKLSPNAYVISVKITNNDPVMQQASIVISSNLYLDSTDSPKLEIIPGNRGFRVSNNHELTILCASSPLVRSASSFWIGSESDRSSNNWTQVTTNPSSGIDAAAIISWKDFWIPAGSSMSRSIIMKFGPPEVGQLELSMEFQEITSQFIPEDPLLISANLTSSRYDATVRLFVVIDGAYWNIKAGGSLPSGTSSFWFAPSTYGIYDIAHQIAFYAVNDYGDVSEAQTLYLNGSPIGEDSIYDSPAFASLNNDRSTGGIIAAVVVSTVVCIVIACAVVVVYRRWKPRDESSEPDDRRTVLSTDLEV